MLRLPALLIALALAGNALAEGPQPLADGWRSPLVSAASAQIGVTTRYDPAYVRIAFPGGDVPRQRGVCTDVIVRAYRDAFGLDLQALVHADMRRAFASYPGRWGLRQPDANIDHRRVGNLQRFFERHGQSLAVSARAEDYRPGDIITQMLPGNLPHIAIVSERTGSSGAPMVIHNIGSGTRQEDTLFAYPLTGHYRFQPSPR